ncbi:unnamed protein product [Soboliphyme baturini]|uniref:MTTase N-terminal domain-containing protein n=1 Tax=Soboliphyme baturini TaxID=241478 RepID=A0A183IAI9_9BILA|nr:unnamed protein product [Soboliphyme baturini]
MSGILACAGYDVKTSAEDADLWLLNSCTVKTPSEDQLRNEVLRAKQLSKLVVVSGCVPQAAPATDWLNELSVVGVHQIDRVVEVVEETLKGNVMKIFGNKKLKSGQRLPGASLALPKIRRNPLIEILAISTG